MQPAPKSGAPIIPILLGLFILGTIVFAVLAYTFQSQASKAKNALATAKTVAADTAREDQKKADEVTYNKILGSPYRAFVAPEEYGAFVINFPKNWSSKYTQNLSGTQIDLLINPEFIATVNNIDKPLAVRVQFIQSNKDRYMSEFATALKRGDMKQADIVVSGQPGFDLTGKFRDNKTVRMVVVPVRDKVLVFKTENTKYAAEFNEILGQAKIIP